MQTVKNGLLSNSKCYVDLNHRLDSFLMAYRSTPHTVTGETPSERFLGRTIMTKLDLIKPKSKIEVIGKVLQNKHRNAKVRTLQPGEHIVFRSYRTKQKWVPGIIVKQIGSKLYKILVNRETVIRHIDQIKRSSTSRQDDMWDERSHVNDHMLGYIRRIACFSIMSKVLLCYE